MKVKKYYPSIQIFRAILFIFVLGFHCNVPFFNLGWGGVEAFFVISAFFLVKKQYGNGDISIRRQFTHRIARLYPPYIVVLVVVVCITLLMKKIPFDLPSHILSLQNIQWMFMGYSSPMSWGTGHTWTLSIEVLCGLMWLFLLKYVPKKHFKTSMIIVAIIAVIYRIMTIVFVGDVYITSLCPIAHMDAFAIGSLFAVALIEEKTIKKSPFILLMFIGIVGVILVIIDISTTNNIPMIDAYKLLSSSKNYLNGAFTGNIYLFISLFTVGTLGLLYINDNKDRDNCIGKSRNIMMWIGDNSYDLYLFHWPILAVLGRIIIDRWFILLPVTLIVTLIATLVFEKIYAKLLICFRRKRYDSII